MGRRRSSGESPEQVESDLRALLVLVERGIALQDSADAVLFACAAPGEPAGTVAREGGRIAGEYQRLWRWSLDFAPHADPESLERRVSQLLMYHCHLLHVAVRFAFPRYRTARTERQRRAVTALGSPAGELRQVRDELTMWISFR